MVAISSNNTDVTVSSSRLTFTTDHLEHSAQTVTVSAGQDADAANDMATLTHNPSGADYNSVSNAILIGDGHGQRHTGGNGHAHVAVGQRGRHEHVYRRAGHPAHGHRDGHHRRSDRQRGRDGKPGEPEVLHLELGYGADGHGFGGRGRRLHAGQGHGDAHREPAGTTAA